MKTHIKKIIIGIIIFLILLSLVITGVVRMKNAGRKPVSEENSVAKNTRKQIFLYTDSIARSEQEHITIREAVIKIFYDYPDSVGTSTIIDGRTFFVVSYYEGYLPGTDTPTGGGVMVFEKTSNGKFNLFWESREYIVHAVSRFQDLTNDGTPEIVVIDSPSPTGSSESLYSYIWRNNTFQLITPVEKIGKIISTKIGGTQALIKDIDGDNIYELIDGYADSDIDRTIDASKDMLHQEIYKYNGTEYYLWKKVTKKAGE